MRFYNPAGSVFLSHNSNMSLGAREMETMYWGLQYHNDWCTSAYLSPNTCSYQHPALHQCQRYEKKILPGCDGAGCASNGNVNNRVHHAFASCSTNILTTKYVSSPCCCHNRSKFQCFQHLHLKSTEQLWIFHPGQTNVSNCLHRFCRFPHLFMYFWQSLCYFEVTDTSNTELL